MAKFTRRGILTSTIGLAAFVVAGTVTTKKARANPTYVITDRCIKCKYQDCVEVCPVDCIYEGENMLVIHPDECIDCGVCEPECPPEAILPDTDPKAEGWLELNRKYSDGLWPNITRKGIVPEDADQWIDVDDKFRFFSHLPGKSG